MEFSPFHADAVSVAEAAMNAVEYLVLVACSRANLPGAAGVDACL